MTDKGQPIDAAELWGLAVPPQACPADLHPSNCTDAVNTLKAIQDGTAPVERIRRQATEGRKP